MIATLRSRRCLVVVAGSSRMGDRTACRLAESLSNVGMETKYIGRRDSARAITQSILDEEADVVELCLGAGGVALLRELLRELARIGRRDVSIVVHRVA